MDGSSVKSGVSVASSGVHPSAPETGFDRGDGSESEAPLPIAPLTIAKGRYALYGEIASGGMATVHFGRLVGAVGFNRPVAIKRLHPNFAKDPEFRSMFLDEARLVSRIRHQNVVPTLDVVASQDELFLVMEYVQGESLWRLMKVAHNQGAQVPVHVAMTIASHVLHGLHAAHEARSETGEPLCIVHRDVSPQNVLVGTDGAARVLDFGVARAALRAETTRQGRVKGKLAYMSPEQLGGGVVTRQADVYAATVILWELLTGRRLFPKGDPQSMLIDKLFRDLPAKPSSIMRGVSRMLAMCLDDVVARGLARDPSLRFNTAREMAVALEGCGKLATLSEVSEWVEALARETLAERARRVAEFESCSLPITAPSAPPPPMPSLFAIDATSSIAPLVKHTTDAPLTPSDPPAVAIVHTLSPLETARRFLAIATERKARPSLASLLEPDIEKLRNPSRWHGWWDDVPRPKRAVAVALTCVGLISTLSVGALAMRALFGWAFGHEGTPVVTSSSQTATKAAVAIPTQPCPHRMVAIPGGKFFMGSDTDLPTQRPAHNVTLAPYCIGVYEVAVEDYRACADRGECKRAGVSNEWASISNAERKTFDPLCNARDREPRARHPINCVDWDMANTYCRSRGARLPTEAEWELAARSPDGRKYPWGDDDPTPKLLNACGRECIDWERKNRVDQESMYSGDDGFPLTAPVGSFPEGRSRYGVEDTAGNVWEWTADWYSPYGSEPQSNPKGAPGGSERVVRGGAWNAGNAAWVRATFRYRESPDKRSHAIGFRCAAAQGSYALSSDR